ncbi:MAG: rod shape-determining protein RodA [Propionibacteriales bacterium]|nr:rod shape-determining protein RodA [Propionibacteriales bacterium]
MALSSPTRPSATRRVVVTPAGPSLWTRLDWTLLLPTVALLSLGALLVWSATAHNDALTDGDSTGYVVRHLVNIGIGGVLCCLVAATDHRWVRIWSPAVYLASLIGLALVFVPGVGTSINGSRSWIDLAGLTLQPAEFAKLAVIVSIALVVAERAERRRTPTFLRHRDVLLLLLIAALPAVLITLQPDLGTMLVFSAMVFGVLALAGLSKRWLAALVLGTVAAGFAALQSGLLEEYQLDRFAAFTDPSLDPLGAGYNTTQARIAIGNGGLFGQGLLDGSQTQSGFVPEQHTDFVFTVAGEELGLVGATAVVGLLGLLLWRGLRIALHAPDLFGRVAAGGIVCWLGFQAFQNIGMCLGIMPVTGVPLPLVSYGGTSMFATMVAIGMLLNIHLRTENSLGLGVVRSRLARSRF